MPGWMTIPCLSWQPMVMQTKLSGPSWMPMTCVSLPKERWTFLCQKEQKYSQLPVSWPTTKNPVNYITSTLVRIKQAEVEKQPQTSWQQLSIPRTWKWKVTRSIPLPEKWREALTENWCKVAWCMMQTVTSTWLHSPMPMTWNKAICSVSRKVKQTSMQAMRDIPTPTVNCSPSKTWVTVKPSCMHVMMQPVLPLTVTATITLLSTSIPGQENAWVITDKKYLTVADDLHNAPLL